MPVQLPAIHAPGILIPPQPEDPPTLDDVHSARLFMRSVEGSYHAGSANQLASSHDCARALLYVRDIVGAYEGPEGPVAVGVDEPEAPPVAPDLAALVQQAVAAALQPVVQHLNNIDERLWNINENMVELAEMSCQAYNAGCGDVLHRPYRVIPFRLPGGGTELPQAVGLPALRNAASIEGLTLAQTNMYLQRYHIDHMGNLSHHTRIKRLKGFVGCA
ncbi:hypothetical protein PAXINDRAFT_178375 [Paxillus involutus ATCC 200175]|nr:hypothetical protein PAXINDRAFT_178375 [Paxillus involutus ATCC 200175]